MAARPSRRRWWHDGVAFAVLSSSSTAHMASLTARGSSTVVGTPTHPQILTCNEEATQFTGGLPAVGPDDIGFGAGYFPKARLRATMNPPNSGRGAQLNGYKLPPVVYPGATVTITIARGAGPMWCNKTHGRHTKGVCRSRTGPVCTSVDSFPRAFDSPMVEYGAASPSTCGSAGNERRATSSCRFSLDDAALHPDPSTVRAQGNGVEQAFRSAPNPPEEHHL